MILKVGVGKKKKKRGEKNGKKKASNQIYNFTLKLKNRIVTMDLFSV